MSTNTFVCGLNNDDCKDSSKTFTLSSDTQLILRPAQIQDLVGSALASGVAASTSTVTAAATAGNGDYTLGEVIGAGCGVGIPLLFALGIVIFLLIREKRKSGFQDSTYKNLDDDGKGSIMIGPAPSMLKRATIRSTTTSKSSTHFGSDIGIFRTSALPRARAVFTPVGAEVQKPASIHSAVQSIAESQRASHIPSLAERIETMRVTPHLVDVRDSNASRHELDSTPSTPKQQLERSLSSEKYASSLREMERFELAAQRMSK